MVRQDTADPDYYHRVVDCQWACPAHTDVPEYIRLVAAERFADAYMLNRESNVFPGVLGRVCDRPCEPACRRGRVDEKPVAICRLKRVAADFKGDISSRLPKIPQKKNGKRVALIGSGPASLTCANDLMPLGYECVVFEKQERPGGAMHAAVPGFRLPEAVLMEEIRYITDMGLSMRYGAPVTSLKALLAEGYDAVFVGSGAPQGRDLELPGRREATEHIHIGLEWLANIAFGHPAAVGERVIVVGGGNTAMDCCRMARRMGGKDVRVVAPEAFAEMLASPWERDDAIEEGIKIVNQLLPRSFVVKAGALRGIEFTPLQGCYDATRRFNPVPSGQPNLVMECDTVIIAVGQSAAYPFIEPDAGIHFANGAPRVDPISLGCSHPKVFFGGDAAFGPKNIIWAVAHGHEAAISIDLVLNEKDPRQRPHRLSSLKSQKMGIHEWSYKNDYADKARVLVPHVEVAQRFAQPGKEVELGFDLKQALVEASRCLNCDVQTAFTAGSCIECDACVDICPVDCLTLAPDLDTDSLKAHLVAPVINEQQILFVSEPLDQTKRVMVKDENLCVHCGLCAERCPTGAWDMQKFTLKMPYAGGIP